MWFKVDDSFFSNPKTAMLSDGATALWLRSGSWSAQQLTGGFVPARMVPMFRGSDDSVRELCDVGLWERDDERDGYWFHDWSDYQPDGEEVDALRRKRSEAGKRGADRRWKRKTVDENGKNGKADGKCHGKPMANSWQTDGKSMANSCPVPVPVPDKKDEEEYSSSSSKEIGLNDFELVREKAHANAAIIRDYPNLDLSDAWNAFAARHYGETRTVNDWCRQWKGWCQRRAKMSGIPPAKPHIHKWQCSHVLEASVG
ncbi:hypothetical protein, partial [Bifidobacterium sp.]|uniref:hypothetical protein n=1 Tax=Bifidobacterium sp. TaxID=41200 RepID=UPI00257F6F02